MPALTNETPAYRGETPAYRGETPVLSEETATMSRTDRFDATSVLPAVDRPQPAPRAAVAPAAAGRGGSHHPESEPVWSARARVVPREPVQGSDFADLDAPAVTAELRGRWWMPVAVGMVVLLLLALLGVGVWMIADGDENEAPAQLPATSAVPARTRPTSAPAVPAPAATGPTATSPTAPGRTATGSTATQQSPAPVEPADVRIPALIGLSSAQARQALDQVGLTYRLRFRPSDAAAGTVFASFPSEGREVPADTEVTLMIATVGASVPSTEVPAPHDEPTVPIGD